ncbi:MAG: HAD-IIA family hydrolase [Nocardioides sp.]
MLKSSDGPLAMAYDLLMFDLDGVVYVGREAIAGVPGILDGLRAAGHSLAFITNNASRSPDAVAGRLTKLGVSATAADVVTSAQAAARMLRDRCGEGAPILMLGADGLRSALEDEGMVVVTADDPAALALSTGYGPDVVWRDIMRAAVRVRDGLPWVASNADASIPTDFGVAPGHGVLVRMLSGFAGVEPEVAGKPSRPLFDETIRRVGGARPLMVGDRLDTDIEGAHHAGVDSLLVLTGVSGLADLVAATPALRPSYISPELSGVREPHAVPEPMDGGRYALGGWIGQVAAGALELSGAGSAPDWWRVAVTAAWDHLDRAGVPAILNGVRPPVPSVPDRAG